MCTNPLSQRMLFTLVRENWKELYQVGEWSYSWSISKVYQDTENLDYWVLHDSGCSCNHFDADSASEYGPFSGVVEVIHSVSKNYGVTADDISGLLSALEAAKKNLWVGRDDW